MRVGYKTIFLSDNQKEDTRWWKYLWKLKAPLKTRVFMWLATKNKDLHGKSFKKEQAWT